jgi:hypothetical protein
MCAYFLASPVYPYRSKQHQVISSTGVATFDDVVSFSSTLMQGTAQLLFFFFFLSSLCLSQVHTHVCHLTILTDAKSQKIESKKVVFKVKEVMVSFISSIRCVLTCAQQKDKKKHSVGKSVTIDLATIALKVSFSRSPKSRYRIYTFIHVTLRR